MTKDDREKLIAWGHMHTASELMHSACEMIWDARWESDNINDPIGVSDRLNKLLVDAKELTTYMQRGTSKLFRNSLDDKTHNI